MGKKKNKQKININDGSKPAGNGKPPNQQQKLFNGGIPKQQTKGQQIFKNWKGNKQQPDNDFVDKFEHRQAEQDPAVLLRNEALSNGEVTSKTEDRRHKNEKNKKRNDGQSAVHKPVDELLSNGGTPTEEGKQKKTLKRKAEIDSSISTGSSAIGLSERVNGFGSKSNKRKSAEMSKPVKNKRLKYDESDESSNSSDDAEEDEEEQIKYKAGEKSPLLIDEEDSVDLSDEEVDDEDEGEDLDEMEEMDDLELEDEDLCDEQSDLGSFLADEEPNQLEDSSEYSDEDGQEEEEANGPVELDILGFSPVLNDSGCMLLKAQEGFSIASSTFRVGKFSSNFDDHSVQVALKALQWILSPVDPQLFFRDIFQKRVLVVKRNEKAYFDGFFGTKDLAELLQQQFVEYGKDVNVASYESGVRLTHNPANEANNEQPQRVHLAEISQHLASGRSIQCVHPQVFNDHVWYICELLQEVFCSFVGANSYLTPANSAGFAPHWDDVDAFMLQTEGKKYWKIYGPEESDDALPLESSGNFTDADFADRKPVFEGWLEEGDTLYVPRGFIHQAHTVSNSHSHHVTISVCRHFAYADFFEMASAQLIQVLTEKSMKLRHSLPPLLFDMGGTAKQNYSGADSLQQQLLPVAEIFSRKFASNFSTFVPNYIDLMAKEFYKSALPPLLTVEERALSCIGANGVDLFGGSMQMEFGPNTEVRLIRKHTQRLLFEDEDRAFIVHRMNNSRRFEERPESLFDFPIEFEDGYNILEEAYPEWTKALPFTGKRNGNNKDEGNCHRYSSREE